MSSLYQMQSTNMLNAQNLLYNYVNFIRKDSMFAEQFSIEDFRKAFEECKIESAADIALTDNTIYGTPACEYLFGTSANDLIYAGDGNDILYGRNGDDILYGEAGNDEMYGEAGNDILYGGKGNDILYGGNGNDLLDGGTGNDILNGGSGNDTYVFHKWDGQDTIAAEGGTDIVRLADRKKEEIAIAADPDNQKNLVIIGLNTDDIITIENYFSGGSIAGIEFADGTFLDKAGIDEWLLNNPASVGGAGLPNMLVGSNTKDGDVLIGGTYADFLSGSAGEDKLYGFGGADYINGGDGNDLLSGGDGDDALYGGNGNDVLIGGKGDDALYGEAGNDIYIFGEGDGHDIISDYDSTAGNEDLIQLRTEYDSVHFEQKGNDLYIGFGNTGDSVTVQSWFLGEAFQIETVEANDGYRITRDEINELLEESNGKSAAFPDRGMAPGDENTAAVQAGVNLLVQSMAGFGTDSGMITEPLVDRTEPVSVQASDLWMTAQRV